VYYISYIPLSEALLVRINHRLLNYAVPHKTASEVVELPLLLNEKSFSDSSQPVILALIYFSIRHLDQDSAKGPFRSSRQAATCYYQFNHTKVEAIPLCALQKAQQMNFAGLFSILSLMLNVKREGVNNC